MTPKILVVPVAFNEKIKLGNVIERFLRSKMPSLAAYLIVDDGSDDGTTEMIASYKERGVASIKHPQRRGVGAAIRTGIEYARGQGYDIIVIMAGNDKDNPEEILQLLEPIVKEGYDLVQGSRYLGKVGSGGQMPFYRKFATRLHPWVFSLFTGRRLTDTTNGFRAIRLKIFEDKRINLNQEWLDTYELEPYILWKAITLGYRFKEVFVTKIYPPKKMGGYTKMVPIISWWSILKPLFYLRLGIKK
ncbi:MAG: glycosyltransferase family 2 protein [Candidatus Omnitrophica bacterium]|nr:glycosyltransferase family 2 protein [Candidatus Omnitrophota bacterium]MDE2222390.1 glycosyltransferase family 2 protein [Candidatus Omnitrophota bacterium]